MHDEFSNESLDERTNAMWPGGPAGALLGGRIKPPVLSPEQETEARRLNAEAIACMEKREQVERRIAILRFMVDAKFEFGSVENVVSDGRAIEAFLMED